MLPDVVIIGGGIVGCACAYFLARAGARVRLLERGPLGSGASKAGMSHVVTWEEPETHLELARASQRLYETLCSELPIDIEYRRAGSLAVVETPEALSGMAAMVERLQQWGLNCHLVNTDDLRRIEPKLSPDLAGGAYFPNDGMVNPLLTTQAFAQAARRMGAVIETGVEVTGISLSPSRNTVEDVRTGAGRIPADCVVIAAGAWSGAVGQMAGVKIPIQPRKGTLVVTNPLPQDFLTCKVILSAGYMDSVKGDGEGLSAAANIQQVKNGNLLLGSTRQFAGYDLSVDAAVVQAVLARCLRFLPILRDVLAVRMWSGLRPYTPDLLPMIGPFGKVKGLFVAAGHEGIGITEAPITGKLISQMIMGEPTEIAVDRLSPDRFQERES